MSWPVPSARQLVARMAGALETAILKARPSAEPLDVSRAVRSARGVLAMVLRSVALEIRSLHDHIRWWARQWFVDTADDAAIIARHADIWGIARRPATASNGTLTVLGDPGTVVPQGTVFAAGGGVLVTTSQVAEIGGDGTVAVSVVALVQGAAGNLEEGVRLAPSPFLAGIDSAAVADGGLAGGADIESLESWQARTLDHIRERPHGGAGFDYPKWLAEAFPVYGVKVLPDWIGRGSVGVSVSMADGGFGRQPNGDELAAMLDHLGLPGSALGVRPVTAHVVVLGAGPAPQALTVRLRPDTAANRIAVEGAWNGFLATLGDELDEGNDSPIGALIEPSRLSEALSAAEGEYAHDLIAPAAPVQLGPAEFATPGVLTFAEAA
ncbi:baseplate J/gp47 family protein [Oceaniradius stylonematis]|uniref:baseplate J/gp47 family protein n=1 Tax=Oceaniradius stylonematis TaxID=2184161 RepID=UPI00273E9658|nr:baseplate J/gp47 family protein [Oceaniradius stylonematis]